MPKRTETVELSNGVRIYGVPVSQALVRRVIMRIPEPPVPVVKLDDGFEEENPDDPDYAEAVDKAMSDRIEAAMRTMIVMGCRIEEPLPEDFPAFEDESWRGALRAAGDILPDDPDELRWIYWRDIILAEPKGDYPAAYGMALAATAILEPEVMRAVEWFQRRAERPADNPILDSEVDGDDGDRVHPPAPGTGKRTRRT